MSTTLTHLMHNKKYQFFNVDMGFSISFHGQVLVPVGFGTEEMEAVIIVDVLRRAGADVTVASVEPQLEIEASGGTKLVADTCIKTCSNQTFDLVALPVSLYCKLFSF